MRHKPLPQWEPGTNGGVSAFTESATFAVTALPANLALSSANICSGANALTSWTSVLGETYLVEFYTVSSSTWAAPTGGSNSSDATQTAPAVGTGYKWQIETTDSNGCVSAFTESATFAVTALPANPALSSANICSGANAVTSWTSVLGETYVVEFYTVSSSTWAAPTGGSSSSDATQNAPAVGTGYKWRIQTTDSNGCVSSFKESATFSVTALPANPALSSANICSGANAVTSWTSVLGEIYIVEFYTVSSSTWAVPTGGSSSSDATQSAPAVGTGYKWRIQTTEMGCTTTWSES